MNRNRTELAINDVEESDIGDYSCVAESVKGKISHNFTLSILSKFAETNKQFAVSSPIGIEKYRWHIFFSPRILQIWILPKFCSDYLWRQDPLVTMAKSTSQVVWRC